MAKVVHNLPAAAYAKPHTMSGGPVTDNRADRSQLSTLNPSVGGMTKMSNPGTKTTGIVTRGNGAATRGITARGPMA